MGGDNVVSMLGGPINLFFLEHSPEEMVNGGL